MGNFCCANCKKPDEELEKSLTLESKKVPNLMKKHTMIFNKSDFIHIKTKSIFEDYEIKGKLGEGSYGCVYKVVHTKTSLVRAVKAIKRKNIDEEAFQNEIAILKSLDHPNIIRLFDVYCDQNYYYLVQEYCSGGNLYDYLKRQKYFSEKKASIIMSQLLSSINHLHAKKYVHRDIKPENIVFIYTENNEIFIKLIDFGTTISIPKEYLTQELGTIFYIAPEVFKNKYNEKCDIWSCGIILYTMLSGNPPFRGKHETEIKNAISRGDLDFSKEIWKKISKEAKSFISSLLSIEPSSRPNAEQAMMNTWIQNFKNSDEEKVLDANIMENLVKFTSGLNLQKAALSFIANQIGQNEEIKKIKAEFDKIDINKDGEISKIELIECLTKIYPPGESKERAGKIFAEIDFNNDGTINFSEFLTVTLKREKILSHESLKNAFDMFDLDGNGYITIDELRETIPIDENGEMTWEDIMKEVDKNGDGQISFKEFGEVMLLLGSFDSTAA